jgi:hypothetical protein
VEDQLPARRRGVDRLGQAAERHVVRDLQRRRSGAAVIDPGGRASRRPRCLRDAVVQAARRAPACSPSHPRPAKIIQSPSHRAQPRHARLLPESLRPAGPVAKVGGLRRCQVDVAE